jgi:hypothetical protein
MPTALPQRRWHRQRLPGELLSRQNLRPADHVARLRRVGSSARGADTLTLEDLIVGVWKGLSGREAVSCPVCGGQMECGGVMQSTSGGVCDGVPHGACGDCGALLS